MVQDVYKGVPLGSTIVEEKGIRIERERSQTTVRSHSLTRPHESSGAKVTLSYMGPYTPASISHQM